MALAFIALYAGPGAPGWSQEDDRTHPPATVVEGQIFDHNGGGVPDVQVKLLAADAAGLKVSLSVRGPIADYFPSRTGAMSRSRASTSSFATSS